MILTFHPVSAKLIDMLLLRQTGSGMILAYVGQGRPVQTEERFLINIINSKLFKHLKRILGRGNPSLRGVVDPLYTALASYTFARPEKLQNLRRLASELNQRGIEGDFVECGTYKGGSLAVLGTELSTTRQLWAYDSFAGMPATTSLDGTDAQVYVGKGIASPQNVRDALAIAKVDVARCTIREGWFQDTFQQPLPASVALLHCDADWHDSVLLVLETLYPLVAAGGCVILDDFGYWEGCREAFYTFCERHQERPLLERWGTDQAYWFKGRQHNRN
jgi:O-methyltransferase